MNSHKQDLQSGQIQSLKVLKVGDKILNTTKRAGAKTQWTRHNGQDSRVLDEGRTQNISCLQSLQASTVDSSSLIWEVNGKTI